MEILSAQQHEAFRSGQIPLVEEFAAGTWSVPLGMPLSAPDGSQTFSLAYVLDDFSGGLHIVDPGCDMTENLNRWEVFFTSIGRSFSDVATVTVTHLHQDHLGLADELTKRSGAPLVMSDVEASVLDAAADAIRSEDLVEAARVTRVYTMMSEARLVRLGVPSSRWKELLTSPMKPNFPTARVRLKDGEMLPIPGRRVVAISTPGHTGGHFCLAETEIETIFTADHVLPGINSGVGLGGVSPTNPIADYLASLDRLDQYWDFSVAPGHEYRFRGLAERVRELKSHHLQRTRAISQRKSESKTVWEVAKGLYWSDGFENLRSQRLNSALSQVEMQLDYISKWDTVEPTTEL